MFKKLGDLIYRTPWWGLLVGGLCVLIGLAMFAIPIHVLRLSDRAKTPEERSAIKREINLAFGDRALHIAESVVGTMRSRASDPERRRELDQALAEMARARKELTAAQGASRRTIESAHETAQSALETAISAAESALESANDAREALEEARDDALAKLRERGIDTKKTAQSFEELLKSARESEATARESLAALGKLRRSAASPPVTNGRDRVRAPRDAAPAPEAPAAAPTIASSEPAAKLDTKPSSRVSIDLDLSRAGAGGADLLPQDVKNDIRRKVAGDVWRVGVGSVLILLFIPVFIMLVIAKYFIGRSRRALAFAEEKKQEAMVSDVNRQITEARLQALQAQVEPHFLYNTLANVQALTEADPPAANAMVGHLIQYLRAALPKMRENTSTVGQEIELVTAYLNVLKMRMGARLEFGIDVPPELMSQPFPPMMLPSLVENAIKHGLEPLREGGRIDVVARRVTTTEGERIQLQVRDTGRGITDSPDTTGGGVGLANLRERLTALYGGTGRFTLESNTPRGVVATIEIPGGAGALRGIGDTPKAAAAEAQPPEPPRTAWRRALQATSRTHSVWAWIASRLFVGLMTILAVVFVVAMAAVYGGWLPVDIAGVELDGIEGMAFGSIVLLVGFAACALAIAVCVAAFYGLGFLVAFLLLAIPVVILVSLFPVLAPFILIGFLVYWLWRRKRKQAPEEQAKIGG
jgi:hypothetical protein